MNTNTTPPVSPSHLPPELDAWVRAAKGRAAYVNENGEVILHLTPIKFASVQDAIEHIRPRPCSQVASKDPIYQRGNI